MGLFGRSKEPDPKEQVNEWAKRLRKEGYQLDRQIRGIQREEEKVKRSLKEAAKKGDKAVCTVLAKEVIHSRKAIGRIYTTKAQINSVQLQMKQQLAQIRVAGAMSQSTEVMQAMQQLVKMPEVAKTMQEMSKEMMKAGILEEMMEDTFEGLEDQDDLEEAAQEEVDKVLWEITKGEIGRAPDAVADSLPAAEPAAAAQESDGEEQLEAMQERLQALRS
ncbi:charged multivesicular body protein 3-like [Pollicipes pollicipes]|uniref:charged multivesicular body protein 3-like n=1 Tax=Pollicipes pollicipes TaxID=41117 RepID=UPI00188505DE|nr:charged multivesicular body protein 3-like [Pollicipes pollicipes]XP_037093129.1 charged multivesicular body protein 3-like [Pollicipes pollicipes]